MARGLFAQRIYPGTGTTFGRCYRVAQHELIDEMRRAGIRALTGFRRGTDVWCYLEAAGDVEEAIHACDRMPAHRRLRHALRHVLVRDEEDVVGEVFYREVFHTDRGASLDGPMARGLLSLVIDPVRSSEYDALHAKAWPELLDALADSGFRNYSGFRRGPHVVYYGEYYPDMRTVFSRMATHEVDARWGRALEGVITTIRGPDKWLLTAAEVFHLASEGGPPSLRDPDKDP